MGKQRVSVSVKMAMRRSGCTRQMGGMDAGGDEGLWLQDEPGEASGGGRDGDYVGRARDAGSATVL